MEPSSSWENCPNCKSLKSTIRKQMDAYKTLAEMNKNLGPDLLLQILDNIVGKEEDDQMQIPFAPVNNNNNPSSSETSGTFYSCISNEEVSDVTSAQQQQPNNDDDEPMDKENLAPSTVTVQGEDNNNNIYLSTDSVDTNNVEEPKLKARTPRRGKKKVSSLFCTRGKIKIGVRVRSAKSNNIQVSSQPVDHPDLNETRTEPRNDEPMVDKNHLVSRNRKCKKTRVSSQAVNRRDLNETEPGNVLTSAKLKSANSFIRVIRNNNLKLFQCKTCDLRMKHIRTARLHVRRVHYGDRLECDLCQDKFYDHNALNKHKAKCDGVSKGKTGQRISPKLKTLSPKKSKKSSPVRKGNGEIIIKNLPANFDIKRSLECRVLVERINLSAPSFIEPSKLKSCEEPPPQNSETPQSLETLHPVQQPGPSILSETQQPLNPPTNIFLLTRPPPKKKLTKPRGQGKKKKGRGRRRLSLLEILNRKFKPMSSSTPLPNIIEKSPFAPNDFPAEITHLEAGPRLSLTIEPHNQVNEEKKDEEGKGQNDEDLDPLYQVTPKPPTKPIVLRIVKRAREKKKKVVYEGTLNPEKLGEVKLVPTPYPIIRNRRIVKKPRKFIQDSDTKDEVMVS